MAEANQDDLDAFLDDLLDRKFASKDDELQFLRFFYENVESSLGPASYEIYKAIATDFTGSTGMTVPADY